MAVSKPRNRTLIFRLTQDEYDFLQAASTGARSLSDFARERLLGSIERPPMPLAEGASPFPHLCSIGRLGRMEAGRHRIPVEYSIRHDRENVWHRNVIAAKHFTFGDVASGLVSEKIGGL